MAVEIAPYLGKRIRGLRKERNLTQEEVARRVGTSQSYLGKIERGSVVVGVEMLQKIAKAMDADIVQFFQHHEVPSEQLEMKIQSLLTKASEKELRLIHKLIDSVIG